MKTISIVLTNYPSHLSSFMEIVYGYEYTHASICLDAMNEKMYSFNYKGFCMETVSKYKRHGVEKASAFSWRFLTQPLNVCRKKSSSLSRTVRISVILILALSSALHIFRSNGKSIISVRSL